MKELIEAFRLEDVSKAGAVFNIDKLTWYNEQYLRSRSDEHLIPLLQQELELQKHIRVQQCLPGIRHRPDEGACSRPAEDNLEQGRFFFEAPSHYDEKALKKAWKAETPELLLEFLTAVEAMKSYHAAALKQALSDIVEQRGLGFGKLMLPARIAVTGMVAVRIYLKPWSCWARMKS